MHIGRSEIFLFRCNTYIFNIWQLTSGQESAGSKLPQADRRGGGPEPGRAQKTGPTTMPAVSSWIIFIQEFLSLLYKQVRVCADLLSNPLVCRIRFFFFLATSHTAPRSEEIHSLWSCSNVLVKRTAVVFKDPRVSLSELNFSLLIFPLNITKT